MSVNQWHATLTLTNHREIMDRITETLADKDLNSFVLTGSHPPIIDLGLALNYQPTWERYQGMGRLTLRTTSGPHVFNITGYAQQSQPEHGAPMVTIEDNLVEIVTISLSGEITHHIYLVV